MTVQMLGDPPSILLLLVLSPFLDSGDLFLSMYKGGNNDMGRSGFTLTTKAAATSTAVRRKAGILYV